MSDQPATAAGPTLADLEAGLKLAFQRVAKYGARVERDMLAAALRLGEQMEARRGR